MPERAAPATRRGNPGLLLIATAFVAVVAVYWPTFGAMAGIWLRSDTFAHGLIVAPVAAYFLYQKRHALAAQPVRPSVAGLLLLVPIVLAWIVASYLDVAALAQFAAVAMIPATALALAGPAVVRVAAFPLAFLFFAVPFGEFLIPTLMEITADLTTLLLRLTGFPVYRTGMLIAVPGGDFEIAKACSGIRYLIASIVLGTIFAYLTFKGWRKRLIFITLAALVPIAANGIRAYLIVVLASLSGMQLAVGIDHFIYGWVFFGIVMFVLFLIGVRFRDDHDAPAERARSGATVRVGVPVGSAVGGLVVLLAGPLALAYLFGPGDAPAAVRLAAPPDGWRASAVEAPWQPAFRTGDQRLRRAVTDGRTTIYEFVDVYSLTDGGVDAASSSNRLVDNDRWRLAGDVPTGDRTLRLVQVSDAQRSMFVATWYQTGRRMNASRLAVKLAEARHALVHGGASSALVAVAIEGSTERDRDRLLAYLDDYRDDLARCLADPAAAGCVR